MNFLLYLAHGKPEILYEAVYSILSYIRISKDVPEADRPEILVYTDNEDLFRKFLNEPGYRISYFPLSEERKKEWRGEVNFIHRIKLKMLQDVFSRELGNILFVDSDTVFVHDISHYYQRIGRGELCMHTIEGPLNSPDIRLFNKIYRFIQANGFAVKIDGKRLEIPADSIMWNSGVIGINDRHKAILQRVIDFIDGVYPQLPLHIIEQWGYSLYFQQYRKIIATDADIYHYWNFKEYRQVLADFFTQNEGRSTQELIARMHKVDPRELIKPKMEYENLRGWRRTWRKLSGVKWKMPQYEV